MCVMEQSQQTNLGRISLDMFMRAYIEEAPSRPPTLAPVRSVESNNTATTGALATEGNGNMAETIALATALVGILTNSMTFWKMYHSELVINNTYCAAVIAEVDELRTRIGTLKRGAEQLHQLGNNYELLPCLQDFEAFFHKVDMLTILPPFQVVFAVDSEVISRSSATTIETKTHISRHGSTPNIKILTQEEMKSKIKEEAVWKTLNEMFPHKSMQEVFMMVKELNKDAKDIYTRMWEVFGAPQQTRSEIPRASSPPSYGTVAKNAPRSAGTGDTYNQNIRVNMTKK